jgi:chromosome segregation ATPase
MTPEQKTPTPRTDAASYFLNMGTEDNPEPHEVVHAERMRVLETELAATLREATKELDRLKAAIAEKDEALRKIQKDAETAINFGTDEHAIFSEIYVTTEGALSSTGSELMERLKKAEAERAEEWRKNRELRSENDTLRASLDDVNASRDRLGKALEELRGAISTFKGHGMPGFTDRALALIVIGETDAALAEWRGEK